MIATFVLVALLCIVAGTGIHLLKMQSLLDQRDALPEAQERLPQEDLESWLFRIEKEAEGIVARQAPSSEEEEDPPTEEEPDMLEVEKRILRQQLKRNWKAMVRARHALVEPTRKGATTSAYRCRRLTSDYLTSLYELVRDLKVPLFRGRYSVTRDLIHFNYTNTKHVLEKLQASMLKEDDEESRDLVKVLHHTLKNVSSNGPQ